MDPLEKSVRVDALAALVDGEGHAVLDERCEGGVGFGRSGLALRRFGVPLPRGFMIL
ncbi:hypothetical protein [Streptomyces flaveolus]|uniref:hypothetical protein n=1 Tax=Streptomyces flaveolus TaxID=67297 RepID=UPI0036FB3884